MLLTTIFKLFIPTLQVHLDTLKDTSILICTYQATSKGLLVINELFPQGSYALMLILLWHPNLKHVNNKI